MYCFLIIEHIENLVLEVWKFQDKDSTWNELKISHFFIFLESQHQLEERRKKNCIQVFTWIILIPNNGSKTKLLLACKI